MDLSNAKAGKYKEDYIVKGLSNDINTMLNLSKLMLLWKIKETKTMHVQADIGKDDIDPNYKVKIVLLSLIQSK